MALRTRLRPFGRTTLSSAPSYDAATTAWIAAVIAAGGTVSTAQKGYVDTLIKGLKSDGTWSLLDRAWLHASENTQQSLIDIVNLGVAINNGATFAANQGYTGNASNAYLDSGYKSGPNYLQNSAFYGFYITNSRTTGNSSDFGSAVNVSDVYAFFGGNFLYNVNSSASHGTTSVTDVQGFFIATRSGVTAQALYKNSSSTPVDTDTTSSTSLPGYNFYMLARNNGGNANGPSPDTIAITLFGGGLTGAQAASVMTRFNAYMTSVGANVY